MAAGDGRRAQRNVRGDVATPGDGSPGSWTQGSDKPPLTPTFMPPSIQPIGGNPDLQMIGGLDAVLNSSTAAAQEVGNIAKELRILNERTLQMSGTRATVASVGGAVPETAEQRALVDALVEAVNEQTRVMVAGMPARQQEKAQAVLEGRTPSPAHTSPEPSLDDKRGSTPEAPASATNRWRDVQGSTNYSLGNLRQDFGRSLNTRLGNATWGDPLTQDSAGRYHRSTGQFATDAEAAQFERREKIMGSVRGAAGALEEGATLKQAGMGMLSGGLAKAAGVAGAVIGIGKQVGEFATNQRATNNEWIRTQGGGQMDAMEERVRSNMFKLSNFGTLTGEDASALYSGVAQTGMSDDQRTRAQDFAVSNYKEMGMTIAQSLDIVSFAAANGNRDLIGLSEALTSVSASAVDANINAEKARETFVANWKSASQVFEGAPAVGVAEGLTGAQTAMGPEFQDVDMMGATSVQNLRIMAAQSGEDLNALLAESMTPGGEVKILERVEAQQQDVVAQQLGEYGTQLIADRWATRKNAATGGDFTQNEKDQITQDLLRNNPRMDVDVMRQVIAQFGGPTNMGIPETLDYAINTVTGLNSPAGEARKARADRVARGTTSMIDPLAPTPEELDAGLTDAEKQQKALADAYAGKTNPAAGGTGRIDAYGVLQDMNPATSDAFKDLEERVSDDGIGEAFLRDVKETGRVGGASEIAATTDDASGIGEVEVNTDSGKRIVSMTEAMSYFRDQIDSGKAKVFGGERDGMSIATAMGVKGDKSVEITSDDEDAEVGGRDLGELGRDAVAARKEAAKESGGTVLITPSPLLLELLQFTGSGNVSVDRYGALEPSEPHVSPYGRSTGRRGYP